MLRSFARTFASSGIFLLFPLFVQAQALSFSVGTATAAPGQKSTGYLEVPAGVDAATSIPVIVINGEKRGPVLALVSGAHGTEYTSIIALERLINLLDPSQISGTVIAQEETTHPIVVGHELSPCFPRLPRCHRSLLRTERQTGHQSRR